MGANIICNLYLWRIAYANICSIFAADISFIDFYVIRSISRCSALSVSVIYNGYEISFELILKARTSIHDERA